MKKLLASVGLLCTVALAWPGIVVASGDTTSELEASAADAPAPAAPADTAPADTAAADTAPTDTTSAETSLPDPALEAPAAGEGSTTTTVGEPGAPDETAPDEQAGQVPPSAAPGSDNAPIAAAPTPEGGPRVRAQQCEPSYPGICVPPGPDLDCAEIDDRNFSVPGDDPFGFDRDGNGIGCEDDSVPATTAPPTTAPPTTPAPTTTPPTTVAPIVAGTTQDRPSGALPVTGSRATFLAVLGFVVLALGVVFAATGGLALRHPPARTRGGFTLTLSNPQGERLVHRVTSRR